MSMTKEDRAAMETWSKNPPRGDDNRSIRTAWERCCAHKDAQHAQALNEARAVIEKILRHVDYRKWWKDVDIAETYLQDHPETDHPTDEAGKCPECKGKRWVIVRGNHGMDDRREKCPSCHGTGQAKSGEACEWTGNGVFYEAPCEEAMGRTDHFKRIPKICNCGKPIRLKEAVDG